MQDWTKHVKPLWMLAVVGEFACERLAIDVASTLVSDDVLEGPDWMMATREVPSYIRSDEGPEFTATVVLAWLAEVGVKTLTIEPGSPWDNGCAENINGKLRGEQFDREIFETMLEARELVERWHQHDNTVRTHSSLGYRPPVLKTIATAATDHRKSHVDPGLTDGGKVTSNGEWHIPHVPVPEPAS